MSNSPEIDLRVHASLQAQNAPRPKASAKEAHKAAQQFEAIFLRMIVKDMRKNATSMTGGGMMGEGVGSDVREGWFDTYMSDHLAATGHVGLADSLYRSWVEAGKVEDDDEGSLQEISETRNKLRHADNQGLSLGQLAKGSVGQGGL